MPDYGQRATDAEFRRLKAKINDVYRQAYKEIEQKGREFAQGHARREAQMRQMVADGKMTQADFDAWMRGQVFQGEQWQKKKQQMADTLYHADQVAQEMVNDSRFNVFAANANYMGYSLEHDAGIKTNFGLYDADSVRRLVKKEPDLLPPKKAVGKDKSYQWYNRQVQTAITQGIIQGESLDKIAHRIGKQTGETNASAMLRNARTMQTGAQNAGRIEGLHQAQELGIKVKKQWMATLDSHTRDAHADLDGQVAEIDEPFDSELGPIMYPGDPDADPANVWNCRCSLVYVYPEYPNSMERRDNETGENVGDMTYKEWVEYKETGERPQRPAVPEFEVTEPEPESEPTPKYGDEMAERGYVGLSGEESDAFMEEHHNKTLVGKHETNTMLGGQSTRINTALRNGQMPTDPKDLKMVQKLDKAIQKNELPQDMTLYRGVNKVAFEHTGLFDGLMRQHVNMNDFKDANGVLDWDAWGKADEKETESWLAKLLSSAKQMRGMEITDNGFMQVSASSQRNFFQFSDFNIQLHAPKGTKAYISDYKSESEIFLARGSTMRILDAHIAEVTADNGVTQRVVQIIAELVE